MSVAALVSAVVLGFGAPQPLQTQDGTALPDIEITGRPTAQAVRDFVGRIALPSRGRALAQWRGTLCPGVVNLDPTAARAIVDQIGERAREIGVSVGEPGCHPNVVMIFTDDGPGMAQALVAADRDVFRDNIPGQDAGTAAFRDFLTADRPVRWWTQTVVIDRDTNQPAFRQPGAPGGGVVPGDDDSPLAAAPQLRLTSASRLISQLADNIGRTIIVIDVDDVANASTEQLGDYLAFIGLAQVDPRADTAPFDTVLNLFDGGGQDGMTEWDVSYLNALYAAEYQRVSPGAQAQAVAAIMTSDRRAAARRPE